MATFLSPKAPDGWYPKPGDLVLGNYGKRQILGRVLRSRKSAWKPCVFSRYGFVGVYVVDIDNGKQRAVNEVRPARE